MPSYVPDIHSGGEGSFVLNGIDVGVSDFGINIDNVIVPITTTKDFDPVRKKVFTRKKVVATTDELTFNAFVDENTDVLSTLMAEDEIPNVVGTFYSGLAFSYPLIIVKSIKLASGGVLGVNTYSVTAENQGPRTAP